MAEGGAPAGEEESDAPLRLGEFIPALLAEIDSQAALSRDDWEYVAGRRFVDYVLRPQLIDYVVYANIAAAVLLILVTTVNFWGMAKFRGYLERYRARRTEKKAARAPVPATASDPLPKEG